MELKPSKRMKNDKKIIQSICQLVCMIFFVLFMCLVYSKRRQLVNDHYGALGVYHDVFAYGGDFDNLGSKYSLVVLLNCIFYFIFGDTPMTAALMTIVPMAPCLFMASYLSSKIEKRVWWLSFPLLFFVLVPLEGSFDTWLYHQWEALIFLIALVLYDKFVNSDNKRRCLFIGIVGILITLYGMLVIGSIMVLVYVVAPFAIYLCICSVKYFDRLKKYIAPVLVLGIVIFFILGVIGFPNWIYHGYGGAGYMSWTPVHEMWNNFMSSLKYIAESWGIDYGGQPLVQGRAILYLPKYAVFFYGLYLTGWYLVKGFNSTDKIRYPIEFLCALCVLCNTGANVLGTCIYSSPSRYFSGAHYALAVLVCRHIARWFKEENELDSRRILVGRSIVSFLSLVLLYFGMNPMVGSVDFISQSDAEITNYLVDKDLEYGLGDLSNVYSFSPISGGKVEAFVCSPGEEAIHRGWTFPELFFEGTNQYRFIYDHPSESNWTEESINNYYGDYISKETIGDRTIYVYDYDVRWKKIMIDPLGSVLKADTQNSNFYEICQSKSIEYAFDLPIGVSRISLNGINLENLDISFLSDSGSFEVINKKIEYNKIAYDLLCDSNTRIKIKLLNNTDQKIKFRYADIRVIYAAKDLVNNVSVQASESIDMPLTTTDRDVTIIVKCGQAKKIELRAKDNSEIKIQKIRIGNLQSVYRVSGLEQDYQNDLYLQNMSDKEVTIQKVSYEQNDIHKLYSEQFNYDVRFIR